MAASTREAWAFNFKRILADLKLQGVTQAVIAERMGMAPPQLNRWSKMIPSPETLDEFIVIVNKLLPIDKRLKPEDFFRDPEGLESAKESLLHELARRAGYELKRP